MSARLSSIETSELVAYLHEPTNDIYLRFATSKSYPQRRGSVERLVAICRARLEGESVRGIAARHAVHMERIRQLLADCRRVGRRRIARTAGECNSKTPADGKVSMRQ